MFHFTPGRGYTEEKKTFKLFQPTTKSVFWTMIRTEAIQHRFNHTPPWMYPIRNWLFKKLVAEIDGKPFFIAGPIRFQQGNHTHIGRNFYGGPNLVILDHGGIYIGDNVMIGPNVTLATQAHPLLAEQRIVQPFPQVCEPYGRGDIEVIAPITIGNNVWIASNIVVCPGVTIGYNAVIGAGSVVTHDIPANMLAYGNPCQVVREISEADHIPEEDFEGIPRYD